MSRYQRLYYVAVATCVIIVLCVKYADSATIQKRAIDESNNYDQVRTKICHKSTPCAWEIYVPFTKEVNHYMPNTCKCPEGTTCTKTDDDLSVSAFVHRCRPDTTPTTISDPDAYLQNVSS